MGMQELRVCALMPDVQNMTMFMRAKWTKMKMKRKRRPPHSSRCLQRRCANDGNVSSDLLTDVSNMPDEKRCIQSTQ